MGEDYKMTTDIQSFILQRLHFNFTLNGIFRGNFTDLKQR